MSKNANLTVNGAMEVSGNLCNAATNNLNLAKDAVIAIGMPIEGSHIGVSVSDNTETPVVITRGLPESGSIDNFFGDLDIYEISENSDGEAVLGKLDPVVIQGENTTSLPKRRRKSLIVQKNGQLMCNNKGASKETAENDELCKEK